MQSRFEWFKWAHKEISLTVSPTMQCNPKLTGLGTITALSWLSCKRTVFEYKVEFYKLLTQLLNNYFTSFFF